MIKLSKERELEINKKFRKIISKIFLFLLIAISLFFIVSKILSYYHLKNLEYNGVISEISYPLKSRGQPDIKIDTIIYHLTIMESKIYSSLRVGDSIVKESGTTTIKLYHKEANGKWREMIFE